MHRTLILLGFFIYASLMLKAQDRIIFDTVFLSKKYTDFFNKHPTVKEITVLSERKQLEYLYITQWRDSSKISKQYDFSFEGDRYLFEKDFSKLPSIAAYIDILSTKVCKYKWSTSLRIVRDSIYAKLTYICNIDLGPDEIYFERIETGIQYPKGLAGLEATIQKKLHDVKTLDSVFLFKAIVRRDSVIGNIEVLEGNDKDVTNAIIEIIKHSGPWGPANQGGRSVHSYVKMFIRVYPGGKIRLYVQGISKS